VAGVAEPAYQHRVLESLASAQNYIAWLASLARPYLGDDPIEIGAGAGDYAEAWLDSGLGRITLTEADPHLLGELRSRFASDDRVAVRELDVTASPQAEHSAVVAFNVLEHIEDDVGALRSARNLVRPGGPIVMLVPAFEFATSRFDHDIGHHRRYTKETLGTAYRRAGLEVDRLAYVNAPGLLAWVVAMKWFRRAPGDGVLLRAWDTLVVPVTRRVEAVKAPPFGQSLLAVGRSA
jgi:2-polyprenyl-3-methyl-5-hydroxy-6-metoxy-1,4-benzoquinol methylase